MATKAETNLTTIPEIDAAEAAMADIGKQTAPIVQRVATHRERIAQAIKELDSERFELISRRDMFRRQAEAVEQGLTMHIEDIEATMQLYERGLNGNTPAE